MAGSKRHRVGSSVFQPSQITVQAKMIKKKPKVPTRSVMKSATLFMSVRLSRTS